MDFHECGARAIGFPLVSDRSSLVRMMYSLLQVAKVVNRENARLSDETSSFFVDCAEVAARKFELEPGKKRAKAARQA